MKRKSGILLMAVLIFSIVPSFGDDTNWKKMDEIVKEKVENGEDSIDVIVQFTILNEVAEKIINKTGKQIKYKYPSINSVAMTLDSKDIISMIENPQVVKIWHDDMVAITSDILTSNAGEVTIQGFIANDTIKATSVRNLGFTGKGVTVAVLDTGLRKTHLEFQGKVVAEYDFVNDDSDATDDHGHGTAVSSLICGNYMTASKWASFGLMIKWGNPSNYLGVAPDAKLIPLKVLNEAGMGLSSQVMAGMQWCIDNKNKYGIKVVNMSLGGNGQNDGSSPQSQLANTMVDAGIVVCIAAGNDGPEYKTVDIPGDASKAITVGGIKDRTFTNPGDNWIFTLAYPCQMYCVTPGSSCSSRANIRWESKADVVASAEICLQPHTYQIICISQELMEQVSHLDSGRSMCSNSAKASQLDTLQVKEALMRTVTPISNAGIYDQGAGLINVQKAISYRQASDRSSVIPKILEILKKNKEKNK